MKNKSSGGGNEVRTDRRGLRGLEWSAVECTSAGRRERLRHGGADGDGSAGGSQPTSLDACKEDPWNPEQLSAGTGRVAGTRHTGRHLISITSGDPRYIAEVAALGRISQLFLVLITFNTIVVEPYIARLSHQRLAPTLLRLIGLSTILSVPVCMAAFRYPQVFLWVLGPQYANLSGVPATRSRPLPCSLY